MSVVRDYSFLFQVSSFRFDLGASAIRSELETRNMKLETRFLLKHRLFSDRPPDCIQQRV